MHGWNLNLNQDYHNLSLSKLISSFNKSQNIIFQKSSHKNRPIIMYGPKSLRLLYSIRNLNNKQATFLNSYIYMHMQPILERWSCKRTTQNFGWFMNMYIMVFMGLCCCLILVTYKAQWTHFLGFTWPKNHCSKSKCPFVKFIKTIMLYVKHATTRYYEAIIVHIFGANS